ncbi:hypothetical protein DL764_009972 [Monosporascus ibericus]|uniref:Uncharacterized protein n=1 Tax=Monosporascus ibericus TaxID=155417 RepID=A0A4Q4STP1_9PEZI|nr:hypothetical protein DL764_009972 [Monosporascus ibericus]
MLVSRILPSMSSAPGTVTASEGSDAEDGEDGGYEHEVSSARSVIARFEDPKLLKRDGVMCHSIHKGYDVPYTILAEDHSEGNRSKKRVMSPAANAGNAMDLIFSGVSTPNGVKSMSKTSAGA